MPNNPDSNNEIQNQTAVISPVQTITIQTINDNRTINNFSQLYEEVRRQTPPNIPPAVIHEKRDYFPPPPYQPTPPQQMCFTDYWDSCLQEEYKLLLEKDSVKMQEIRKFFADLKKEGKTKCLRCFQTFSQDKDKDKFNECLVKKICPECQAKKEKKITNEWREFQQKLGMPVELPKTWWGELSPPLVLIAFSPLIFFGWNKFYAWYEKPLTEEWEWDDEEDDEDEKEINKQADTEKKEPMEEIPAPKTMSDSELTKNSWGKVKYWLWNNKVRTFSLISLIFSFLFLVFRIVRFLKKPV